MGWLYIQDLGGHHGPRDYLDKQFTFTSGETNARVLKSALVKMRTYYAALERTGPGGEREVFAVICLVQYNRKAKDGYIFGYKDMDESMGPYQAECPTKILDLLTPTNNPHAMEWRAKCTAFHAHKASRPKVSDGDTIIFDQPLTFTDGTKQQVFRARKDPANPRRLRFQAIGNRGPFGNYRIPGLERRLFRVERPTAQGDA